MLANWIKKIFPPKSAPVIGKIQLDDLRPYLPDAPIIFEAGAYMGEDTLEMARHWPAGHVHAFEPMPGLYKKAVERTRRCANVTCYPFALGKEAGHQRFYVSGGDSTGSSSLLPPKGHLDYHPTVTFQEEIEVETLSLDDWAQRYAIPGVDFMWLDLQGYELFALQGAEEVLKTTRAIYAEVSLVELYQGAPLYPELRAWLETRGFRVERELLAWKEGGNVLFVRQG
ncbi:MAG: FkbM family methyltransferase [Anaerolineaceae bacterium]|nr:FkbM family methyltransferase [Anaerolineaceae bacterium]